jgi:hypothetical protein
MAKMTISILQIKISMKSETHLVPSASDGFLTLK